MSRRRSADAVESEDEVPFASTEQLNMAVGEMQLRMLQMEERILKQFEAIASGMALHQDQGRQAQSSSAQF